MTRAAFCFKERTNKSICYMYIYIYIPYIYIYMYVYIHRNLIYIYIYIYILMKCPELSGFLVQGPPLQERDASLERIGVGFGV